MLFIFRYPMIYISTVYTNRWIQNHTRIDSNQKLIRYDRNNTSRLFLEIIFSLNQIKLNLRHVLQYCMQSASLTF